MITSLRWLIVATIVPVAIRMASPTAQPAAGALAPCPNSPNCVSTEAVRESQRMPTVPFTDTPQAAQARAKAALLAEPRSKITSERDGAIHGECRSFLFRFVDDVDIVIDPVAHVFRFRSASRVGKGDLGVNRKRMTRITARLQESGAPGGSVSH